MIRRKEECQVEHTEHARGGDGTLIATHLINGPEDLSGKGRLFNHGILEPGCGIGYHEHDGDAELYYILKGTAEYNDNGVIRTVSAGDVTICPSGEGHGLANKSDEVVEFIALIVYD